MRAYRIAVPFSPAVCSFPSFWLATFGTRNPLWYCGTVHCSLLSNACQYSVPDPDLEIRKGGGGAVSQKIGSLDPPLVFLRLSTNGIL